LNAQDEEKILANVESMPRPMKPSFLLDVESGGPTEIDDLSGAVSRLGRQAGVATPVHDVATAVFGVAR
jgi:2-dehydropantoate 2-reductase